MNDPSGVSRVQCVGDIDGEREKHFHFQRTPSDAVFQGRAVQKLHGDEGLAILLTDVINGANIRMIQSGGRLRLTLKPRQGLAIAGHFRRQEFEGHKTVQARVFGLVHYTHPTATELLDHAIMRDGLTNHGGKAALATHVRLC